jgi:acyl carrier protein
MGLDTVEMVMSVEETFGIRIPNEVAATIVTVGQLHEHVVAELNRCNAVEADRERVFEQLRDIICEQLGVDPALVRPEARIVEDLGAD